MGQAIRPRAGIERIALYQGGESKLPGRSDVLKLSSNENPAGPPPSAVDAFRAASDQLHRYPSTDHAGLRAAIGEVHGLDPDRIICGAGSDEIIAFLCYAYAGPGTEVIHTEHGFSMYRISAMASGAEAVEVGETERRVDVDKILDGVTDRTRLVFIANPANPTGTMIGTDDIARLADNLPAGVILVLDGAYAEFAEGYDGGVGLIDARENVFMTRTFSKLYGLGGLRIGWGYGPQGIIDDINRVRGPFNLSNAQLAAGEAAVRDREWALSAAKENTRLRDWLTDRLRGNRIQVDDSHANFVLARFDSEAEALACDAALREAGILVRRVAGYGLPEALRITVGLEADCERVARVIDEFRGRE